MADNHKRLSARCRAFFRAVLLFGLPLVCGIAALAGGAAKGDTASAVPCGAQLAEYYNALRLRTGSDTIGEIYVAQGRMLRHHKAYDANAAADVVSQVNAFADAQNAPVYWVAVPTAAGIYAETLPSNAPQANEQALLLSVEEKLHDSITVIDVYSWLYAMRDAYIYYRTDSHWTSYGAFSAYKTVMRKLGFSPVGYDRFRIRHLTSSYQGDFAAETGYRRLAGDVVDLYECEGGAECTSITVYHADGSTAQTDSLYDTSLCADAERLAQEAYAVFPMADAPMMQLTTDLNNGRQLLLLTDDYGAAMLPFLTQHYEGITVINTQLTDAAALERVNNDFTQIVILCSADTIAEGHWWASTLPEE